MLRDADPACFLETIRKDRDHFSEVSHNEAALKALSRFLEVSPDIYRELTDKATSIFGSFLKLHPAARARAFYASESIEQHLNLLESVAHTELSQLRLKDWLFTADACETDALRQRIYKLAINQYVHSANFDLADAEFDSCISPFLEHYTRPMIEALLQGIEANAQTWRRKAAASDHPKIKVRADAIGIEDFTPYPNFMSSVAGN